VSQAAFGFVFGHFYTVKIAYSSLQGVSLSLKAHFGNKSPTSRTYTHINHFQVQKWKLVASTWVRNKSDATLRFLSDTATHREKQVFTAAAAAGVTPSSIKVTSPFMDSQGMTSAENWSG
jgi:hypothetical protein